MVSKSGSGYKRRFDSLAERIQNGEYCPNDRLGSDLRLSRMFGTNRGTVIQARVEIRNYEMLFPVNGKETDLHRRARIHISGGSANVVREIRLSAKEQDCHRIGRTAAEALLEEFGGEQTVAADCPISETQ